MMTYDALSASVVIIIIVVKNRVGILRAAISMLLHN
jgi:hypothetical protein